MISDLEYEQLAAAGFAEVDADWLENHARTWGINAPFNAYQEKA